MCIRDVRDVRDVVRDVRDVRDVVRDVAVARLGLVCVCVLETLETLEMLETLVRNLSTMRQTQYILYQRAVLIRRAIMTFILGMVRMHHYVACHYGL